MPDNRDDDRRRPNRDDDPDDRPKRRRPDDDDDIDERDSERPRRRRNEDDDIDERDLDRTRRRRDDDDYDDDDRYSRRRRQSYSGDELRGIASSQKAVLVCLLGYIIALVATFALGGNGLIAGVVCAVLGITATVFVFLLATKIYEGSAGILLGILTLIPCIGLIALLVVNQKATSILKDNGVGVGLLGANSDDLDRAERRGSKRRKRRSLMRDEDDDDDD